MAFNQDVDFNETREVEINVIGWVFTGMAIATVGLKLFARGHMAKNLGWDDFFILLSMVSTRLPTLTATNRLSGPQYHCHYLRVVCRHTRSGSTLGRRGC